MQLAFTLRKKRFALPLFALALSVAISRIYLVQHFWPDVYVGALIGAALAILIFLVQNQFVDKPERWLDRPLFKVRRRGA